MPHAFDVHATGVAWSTPRTIAVSRVRGHDPWHGLRRRQTAAPAETGAAEPVGTLWIVCRIRPAIW